MPVKHAAVTTDPLDVEALRRAVETPTAGAVTCFIGQIRDHDPEADGVVTGIDYTHHPDASQLMTPIITRVLDRLDPQGEATVSAVHRVGHLNVGDLALVVCAATAHRRASFEVCEAIVEAIKAELPIWKQQFEATGRQVWSNLGVSS
ncbi:MAG: molybdenum cofactor biosynthesis protein MoaE [Arachnia sp.]